MFGMLEDDLLEVIGVDMAVVYPCNIFFGFLNENWKEWKLDSGLEVLVLEKFTIIVDEESNIFIYFEGDISVYVGIVFRIYEGIVFFIDSGSEFLRN